MHKNPFLWRLHSVHHSDRDLDSTTALRFHPFELIVSTFYKSAIVALLGVPVLIVLLFELWLNANALFNHSNLKLPPRADRWLRTLLVTPDMHLVHHSTTASRQQHNFGFALTIWDRIFQSYASGPLDEPIGLASVQNDRPAYFAWSMVQPFRKFD
jgi:sterol desaturase/sphingolipid hydroxylase (fatty acid hydroxylase superfamily)